MTEICKCLLLLIKIFGNGIPCIILCVCLYLKLIVRISRFRMIVTHQKAEDNNKLKKKHKSTSKSSILYFIHHSLPFVSS